MTAKKTSLLARGVLIEDFQDTRALLSPENINQNELLNYAKDAGSKFRIKQIDCFFSDFNLFF